MRRATDGKSWVLVHPRCARDRAEDLEEVRAMIDAGETDIAIDELRWLLDGCSEFIAAHVLLGELAVSTGDVPLARGHYGAGYQLGLQTLRRAGMPRPLLYSQPANRPFFDAADGLIACLVKQGNRQMAGEIVETVRSLDPSNPLELREARDTSIVDLSIEFPRGDETA